MSECDGGWERVYRVSLEWALQKPRAARRLDLTNNINVIYAD